MSEERVVSAARRVEGREGLVALPFSQHVHHDDDQAARIEVVPGRGAYEGVSALVPVKLWVSLHLGCMLEIHDVEWWRGEERVSLLKRRSPTNCARRAGSSSGS